METKVSKSQQIRDYITANPSASMKEVAEKLDVNLQYVYDTKSRMNGKSKKRGRPRSKPVNSFVTPVVKMPMQTPSVTVDGLKQRIRHLEVELELQAMIINALKNRLYAAAI